MIEHADLLALAEPEAEPVRETATDNEGWVTDLATGQVLGNVNADETIIDSTDRADAALELRSQIEGGIAGDRARLEAVTAMLQARIAQQERRLKWWDWRYAGQLEQFARRQLQGRKERTWRGMWGQVAFRRSPGRNRITDMPSAVAWMRERQPELIRVAETVTSTDVLQILGGAGEATKWVEWFEMATPGETVTITTGVSSKKGVELKWE